VHKERERHEEKNRTDRSSKQKPEGGEGEEKEGDEFTSALGREGGGIAPQYFRRKKR